MSNLTTYHTESIQGIPVGVPNKVSKQEKTHYVSYNNYDRAEYGCDTTALYINETSQFLILNGNHSSGYDGCDSLQDCVDYFYENVEQANSTNIFCCFTFIPGISFAGICPERSNSE